MNHFYLTLDLGPPVQSDLIYGNNRDQGGKKRKMLPLLRFFFTEMAALEINRLDKIARRSKRVGGAIADLWGSHQ